MSNSSSPDDELLSILLANLRNAAATFGEGSPPHESIRTTVDEHLQAMKAKGLKTDVTNARALRPLPIEVAVGKEAAPTAHVFASLAFRPKRMG